MADQVGVAPPINGILETAIYVDDMARAVGFYRDVLGLVPMLATDRLTAFDAGRGGVLLIFLRGASLDDMRDSRGVVPGHDGHGPLHFALAIAPDRLDAWRAHLAAAGIILRGEMRWARGGTSLYFADPDGHVVELATPACGRTARTEVLHLFQRNVSCTRIREGVERCARLP